MDIDIHLRKVEKSLSSRPDVISFENPNIKVLNNYAHRAIVHVRLVFIDGSFLDFSETTDTNRCYPLHLKYRYQYMKQQNQIFRYDNNPHHPNFDTFPAHKHIGPDDDNKIIASRKPSHNVLFHEISQHLGN